MLPALFPPVHSLVRDRLSNELAATGMTVTGGTGVHPLCPEHPFLPWCSHRAAPAPRPFPQGGHSPLGCSSLAEQGAEERKRGAFSFSSGKHHLRLSPREGPAGTPGPAEPPTPSPTGGQHSPTCPTQGPSLLGTLHLPP